MEETMVKVSLAETKKNIEAYFATHDVQYVAEDAVFTHLNTGEKTVGREAIGQMLHYIYHVAFDAQAEIINTVITEDHALLEANIVGRHIGEFAGVPPTNKNVNFPVCVCYDLENGMVKNARVYMLMDVLMKQLAN
jgi:predicted ester cyclase